ncbi:MAG: hypothetical protein JRJ21_02880 [Deltaproteobacteria bacterium]|nr:hypothetical protein [Deltaproteobacteria bacterium]
MEDIMNLQEALEKLKKQWRHFFETVKKPRNCIFCEGTRIYWNGQRERTASVLTGDEVVHLTDLLCKRVKCANPECKKSWTLRPPGLMPRRHYQLCVVAHGTKEFLFDPRSTLTSVADEHQCSRRTVGRWLAWISEIAEPANLVRHLFSVSKERAVASGFTISEMIRKGVNAGKKAFQRSTENFCLLEALGTAYGHEPPGFRGMIESAIANRDHITTYRSPFIPELAR